MASMGGCAVVFLAGLVVIAGCVDGPGAAGATGSASDEALPPSVDADTGALAITITTSELQPVPDAQVVLDGTDRASFTDANGQVTFSGLTPGPYTVLAAKPGYTSSHEKGKVVEVVVGEVAEVQIVMAAVVLVDPENAYARTTVVTGMVACAFWISVVGYNNNCGRGVYTTGGNQIANPNDKTTHPWEVENAQVETLVLELTWTPTQAALGSELWGRIMAAWVCDGPGGQTCGPYNDIENKGGKSPLTVREDEGNTGNITKKVELYAKAYPYKVWIEVRPWCVSVTATPPGSCTHNIMVNQKYEGFATAFYGEAAPAGFSARPS